MEIPARDVVRSAEFYQAVFGWRVTASPNHPGFEDGNGHVIGHWIAELSVAGEAGLIPFIYVQNLKNTLQRITDNGGEIVKTPNAEGDLCVANFEIQLEMISELAAWAVIAHR